MPEAATIIVYTKGKFLRDSGDIHATFILLLFIVSLVISMYRVSPKKGSPFKINITLKLIQINGNAYLRLLTLSTLWWLSYSAKPALSGYLHIYELADN